MSIVHLILPNFVADQAAHIARIDVLDHFGVVRVLQGVAVDFQADVHGPGVQVGTAQPDIALGEGVPVGLGVVAILLLPLRAARTFLPGSARRRAVRTISSPCGVSRVVSEMSDLL